MTRDVDELTTITLTLSPEQRQWLMAEIAAGRFASVEEAAQAALEEMKVSDALVPSDDDLAWAKPLVDAAIAQVEKGEVVTMGRVPRLDATQIASVTATMIHGDFPIHRKGTCRYESRRNR